MDQVKLLAVNMGREEFQLVQPDLKLTDVVGPPLLQYLVDSNGP